MGEGNHTPSVEPLADILKNKTNNKQQTNQWKYLIAGTAGAALIAVALFQVYKTHGVNAATGIAKVANQPASIPKNMARVGNALISYNTVAREAVTRHGEEVLDMLIKNTMIQQACREKGIVVTEAEVDNEVLKISKKFNLDPANWYQMLISERNISRRQYRRDIILPMLSLKKLARADTKVTSEDLRKAYIRDYGERVKVRMIMMDKLNSATESVMGINGVWNELAGALQQIPKGDIKKTEGFVKKFEQLAQRYSIEPTSRALGGQVPPIPKYAGNGKIEKAAFGLNQGELSKVIQLQSGISRYVILYCEGRTTPDGTDFSDVKKMLTERIKEEKIQISVAKVFSKIKANTDVQNFFTGTTTGRVKQTSFSSAKPATSSNYTRPRRTTSRN